MLGNTIRGHWFPSNGVKCLKGVTWRCTAVRDYSSESYFTPRTKFPVPPSNSFTWFPGHMLAGLRTLSEQVQDTDLIIETRDARIPLSSRNPYLDDMCANRRRLVLYNKRDLAGLTEVEENVRDPEERETDGRE
jgi:hypothetical protein